MTDIDKKEDCGTTKYLEWTVLDARTTEDGQQTCGDLVVLAGRNYTFEGETELRRVTKESTDLIGKTIFLRSPLFCLSPDPEHICKACMGDNYVPVPDISKVGRGLKNSIIHYLPID